MLSATLFPNELRMSAKTLYGLYVCDLHSKFSSDKLYCVNFFISAACNDTNPNKLKELKKKRTFLPPLPKKKKPKYDTGNLRLKLKL